MRDRPLTLMAVHAHPDDEATSTGGILARYSAEGIRTVLVTCTNGELGDSAGAKPGEQGHSTAELVAVREQELRASCRVLGVSHLEMLGYHDSGMMGWEDNDRPGSFWSTPVEEAAAKLQDLLVTYRPDVVVTYDERGFYGHPDHIQAHRITLAALEASGLPAKLYFSTVRHSSLAAFRDRMSDAGVDLPDVGGEQIGAPDASVAAEVECSDYVGQKFDALAAHASQAENIFFLTLPRPVFAQMMAREAFLRHRPVFTGGPVEDDLFAGLR